MIGSFGEKEEEWAEYIHRERRGEERILIASHIFFSCRWETRNLKLLIYCRALSSIVWVSQPEINPVIPNNSQSPIYFCWHKSLNKAWLCPTQDRTICSLSLSGLTICSLNEQLDMTGRFQTEALSSWNSGERCCCLCLICTHWGSFWDFMN